MPVQQARPHLRTTPLATHLYPQKEKGGGEESAPAPIQQAGVPPNLPHAPGLPLVLNRYEVIDIVGEGAYGIVLKCKRKVRRAVCCCCNVI